MMEGEHGQPAGDGEEANMMRWQNMIFKVMLTLVIPFQALCHIRYHRRRGRSKFNVTISQPKMVRFRRLSSVPFRCWPFLSGAASARPLNM